jgi:antitoxin component YwqK of YwqJK toxin-antitoxin module
MKKILFVLFCCVALIGCNNELSAPSCDNYKNYSSKDSLCILKDYSPTQDFTYDTERLYDGKMIDKSGYVSICGDNGTLVTLVYYKNGKRDRLMRRWHLENGNLGYECTYVNGKKDGFEGVWDVNGQPQEENHYKNGIWDYPRKRWYVNGQLKSVEYEPKQTISQHLLREEWYENGQLKQAFYNIRTRKWSEDGTLIHEGTLMEGGKWVKTLWYENGQLKQVSPEMKSNEEIAVTPLAKEVTEDELELDKIRKEIENIKELESSTFPGIYPQSSERILTESDLEELSGFELRLMRNEIYARYGRKFKSSDLNAYFNSQFWYQPLYDDVYSSLSDLEKYNIKFIKSYE